MAMSGYNHAVFILCRDTPGSGVEINTELGNEAFISANPSQFQVVTPGLDGSPDSVSFKYVQPADDIFNTSFTDSFLCARAGKLSIVECPETRYGSFKLLRVCSDSDDFRLISCCGGSLRADDTNSAVRITESPEVGTIFTFDKSVGPGSGVTDNDSDAEDVTKETVSEDDPAQDDEESGTIPEENIPCIIQSNSETDSNDLKETLPLLITGNSYSEEDILDCLDNIGDDEICIEQPENVKPTINIDDFYEETDELLGKLNELVNKDLLTDVEHDELESLLLMLELNGEDSGATRNNPLYPITEEVPTTMGQMLGVTPHGPLDSDDTLDLTPKASQFDLDEASKELLSEADMTKSEESILRFSSNQRLKDSSDSLPEDDQQSMPAVTDHIEKRKSYDANEARELDEPVAEEQAEETAPLLLADSSAMAVSKDGSFISCSGSIHAAVSEHVAQAGQDDTDDVTSVGDMPRISKEFDVNDEMSSPEDEEQRPLLQTYVIEEEKLPNGSFVIGSTEERKYGIRLEINPEDGTQASGDAKADKTMIEAQPVNGSIPRPEQQENKSPEVTSISFPLDSVALTEDFFLKYADILDSYLSEAVDRFEAHLYENSHTVYDLLQRYHARQPCQVAKDDTGLEEFVSSAVNEHLLPSLDGFKDSLLIDTPEVKPKSAPQIMIPANALRKVRQNFSWRAITDLIQSNILDAVKASKPLDVESVSPMVIQNLDVRFSHPDVGHELLCCVWRQTVGVFTFCKISAFPANSYPPESFRPLDVIIHEMKKDLVLQVDELLAIEDPDHIQEVLKKPAFTACPAMFVLKQLQTLADVTLTECRLQEDEALLLSIERIVCESDADGHILIGRLLQELLLRIDPLLVVQTSGLLPNIPITDKNRTTPLEVAIKVPADDVTQRSFSDLIISCSDNSSLNKPVKCSISELFGFKEGIFPLVLAAVSSGSDMLKKLQVQGARFDATDQNGNFFHNIVQFYNRLGNDPAYIDWRNRLLSAHLEVWELEGVDASKQLMQARSEQKLTPLELAIKLDCLPFFEAITDKLVTEAVLCGTSPVTMYDVTDLDRAAFAIADTSPSGVNSAKSERSYFALDLAAHLAVQSKRRTSSILDDVLIKSLLQSRVKSYKMYYNVWGILHLVFMVLMTACAVFRPLNKATLNDILTTPGDKARLFGEIVVFMYSLCILFMEIYDLSRFSNICSPCKAFHRGLRNIAKGKQSVRAVLKNICFSLHEAFHLCSLFRWLLFVFGCTGFLTFALRLSSSAAEVVVLAPSLIIGWTLLLFFLAENHFAVVLINLGRWFLSYTLVYGIVLIGFTSALYVSCQSVDESIGYWETLFLMFRLLVTSEGSDLFSPPSILSALIYSFCLFLTAVVLITTLIAVIVSEYRSISKQLPVLSIKLLGSVLLLVERRLPTSAKRVKFLIKNGRAFYLVQGKPQLERTSSLGHMANLHIDQMSVLNQPTSEVTKLGPSRRGSLLSRRQSKTIPANAMPRLSLESAGSGRQAENMDAPLRPLMVSSPMDAVAHEGPMYASARRPDTLPCLGSGELSPIEAQATSVQSFDVESVVNV